MNRPISSAAAKKDLPEPVFALDLVSSTARSVRLRIQAE
jgi:hypothetical protein